jgi:hypothetical protein
MGTPLNISERFVAQCSPVIGSNYDTCGTVTRATMAHLNVNQLDTMFKVGGLFADLEAWFMHSIEMKACGTRRFGLYDWIMANADRTLYKAALSKTHGVKSESLLHPFVFGRQQTIINKDHWKVTTGFAVSAYTPDGTTGPLTTAQKALSTSGTDRVIRVGTRYSIPMDANWFRTKESVHIFGRHSSGVTEHGQWKVLASAAAADQTYVDVLVSSLNTASTEPFSPTPTAGVLIPGINNVSDYEKWCQNLPTIDPRKRVPFWAQTFRTSRCIDEEYRIVYEKLMGTNPAFKEFGDLDIAERNRQDELEMQKRFVNDFFFNKPISTDQTLARWEYLEAIYTVNGDVIHPGTDGKIMGRRANWIGVREQLRVCNRVKELANQDLNLYEFLDINYQIKRARESNTNGTQRTVTDIDWWTDSAYRVKLMTAFLGYYKAQFLDMLRITVQVDQVNEELGVTYDSYKVQRPAGVRINIMSNDYFDDYIDQFDDQSISSAGRRLWCLDIGAPGAGTIYYAQLAANKKTYQSAKLEELARIDTTYRCVMANTSQEISLYSEMGMPVVECPLNSLMIDGLGDNVSITAADTATTAEREDLY